MAAENPALNVSRDPALVSFFLFFLPLPHNPRRHFIHFKELTLSMPSVKCRFNNSTCSLGSFTKIRASGQRPSINTISKHVCLDTRKPDFRTPILLCIGKNRVMANK